MRAIALLAVLCVLPAAGATTDADRAEAAERLAARAQQVLDGVLGPGRSQVQVEVQGERSELTSESEILLPIDKSSNAGQAALRLLDLPGYAKGQKLAPSGAAESPAPQPFFQKDHEVTRRDAGFQIRSVQVTAVLDAALTEDAARGAGQLLTQVLHLDKARGDSVSVVRAPLRPAWRSALSTPADWRAAAYAAGAAAVLLLAALIAGAGLIGAGRAFGRELARPRREAAPFEELPELAPGSAGLLEAAASVPAGGDVPLLGRRFDFLAGREPELIVRGLARETTDDMALFFGHLAESIPDLASRLFSHLPPDVQAAVSEALLRTSLAEPERLNALEERLRRVVDNGVLGPQSLGRILSRVPGHARADVLGRLAASDSRAAEEVERHVFAFENLDGLGSSALRRLLGAMPYEVWGPALRGAPSGLVERVLAELPEGPRELVRSASAKPQTREKIAEERSKILDVLSALAAKGELTLGRSEADRDFV